MTLGAGGSRGTGTTVLCRDPFMPVWVWGGSEIRRRIATETLLTAIKQWVGNAAGLPALMVLLMGA